MASIQDAPIVAPVERLSDATRSVPQRIGYVDALRALTAIYVVIHHTWLTIWQVGYNIMPHRWEMVTLVLQYGHFAVSVFIVLSGYSLMLPVIRHGGILKGGCLSFIMRRMRRILPAYWGALFFSTLCFALLINTKYLTIWDVSIPIRPINIVTHLWMIHDIVKDPSINYVFWSIAVEWRIYFLFPILVLLARRYGYVILLTIWGTGFGLYFCLHQAWQQNVFLAAGFTGLALNYIGLFCLGMLAAKTSYGTARQDIWLRNNIPWRHVAHIAAIVLLGYFLWLNPALSTMMTNEQMSVADFIIGIITPALLISLSDQQTNQHFQLLHWKPLVTIGGFSYSLYLIHAPLVQIIWQYIVNPLHQGKMVSFLLLLGLDLPLILLAAKLFSLVFEQPFIQSQTQSNPVVQRQQPAIERM